MSERIRASCARRPSRKHLVANEVTVDRNLHEREQMQRTEGMHGHTRAEIGNGSGRVGKVRQGPLVGTLVSQVDLQLRHPVRMSLVAQAEAQGLEVSGTKVVTGLIHLVADGTLKLPVHERVEVLADRLVVISTN